MTATALIDRIKYEDRSDASIGMRRYEVFDADGTHLGWVVRWDHKREWTAFVAAGVNYTTSGYASQKAQMYAIKRIGRTRREAVDEIASWLEIYALYP